MNNLELTDMTKSSSSERTAEPSALAHVNNYR